MPNPLSPEQVKNLKDAQRNLASLSQQIKDAKQAKIDVTQLEHLYNTQKEQIDAMVMVYGNKS